ncbi:hypothetical protein CV102_19410 [Natronococcus pandeyae]|uniref:Uncharacterized protein n=1 Tax=Natronococcus pandeyae TaxID=2055836 RepID=A0A8J8Q0W4_9EURY|nr:hypothetical protein [Natronococcus pandeyae]TYL36927.1 hypothetical protein CV102_19410 [Natronococcus pandeyae]
MERRTFIVGTSVGAGAVLAGCMDAEEENLENGTGTGTDETEGSNDGEGESEEEIEDDDTEPDDESEDETNEGDGGDETEVEEDDDESEGKDGEGEGEDETDELEDGGDQDEDVDESEDDDDGDDGDTDGDDGDEPDTEEPPVAEITIQVTSTEGEPIENAVIGGEGEPHEAEIPLEFDGETNADGVHSTPIYENEYSIEVDHPDYVAETVEHVHDGETGVTVELEAEDDESEDDDDSESDSFDEMEGEVNYSGDYQEMYEVTEHSIERQNPGGDDPPLCLITFTVENVTENHEVMVYYRGVAVDEDGSSVGSGTDSATLVEPEESSESTIEAYDCGGASDYQISLEAANANDVSGED